MGMGERCGPAVQSTGGAGGPDGGSERAELAERLSWRAPPHVHRAGSAGRGVGGPVRGYPGRWGRISGQA